MEENEAFERVSGVEKLSMIDMRGYASCVLFSNGCSGYKCPYCYNVSLWKNELPEYEAEGIKRYLLSRQGLIDYVVFSGGECTIWPKYLKDSARWCKNNGFRVKVDTNGSNPYLIMEMYEDGLLDYVALDYKYPLSKENAYRRFHDSENLKWHLQELLSWLIEREKKFETRTTIHPDITNESDANLILDELSEAGYKGTHFFQFFNECPETLGKVNQHPRRFKIEELKIPDGMKVEYRNLKNNERRH